MLKLPANTRPIVLASMLGALVAFGTLYENSPAEWQDVFAAWGVASGADAAKRGSEDWPICSSIEGLEPEADWAELDTDFAAGKLALAKGEWENAITAFNFAAVRDPRNADVRNYIGYAFWRLSELGAAEGQLKQAILINPRHRAAHEHLGEIYLALNETVKAEEHLTALKEICLIPCAEFASLRQKIAAHNGSIIR